MDNIYSPDQQIPNQLPPHHVWPSLKILVLIFGIVVAATLGYLVYAQSKVSDETDTILKKPKKAAVTTQPTTTTDPTADWKTYSDTTLGFSIKYPPAYTATVDSQDTSHITFDATTGGGSYPDLSITVKDTSLSLADYLLALKANKTFSGEVATTLNGVDAYEGTNLGALSAYSIIVVRGGKSYDLVLQSNNKDTTAANKAELSATQQSLLNAFKFL